MLQINQMFWLTFKALRCDRQSRPNTNVCSIRARTTHVFLEDNYSVGAACATAVLANAVATPPPPNPTSPIPIASASSWLDHSRHQNPPCALRLFYFNCCVCVFWSECVKLMLKPKSYVSHCCQVCLFSFTLFVGSSSAAVVIVWLRLYCSSDRMGKKWWLISVRKLNDFIELSATVTINRILFLIKKKIETK